MAGDRLKRVVVGAGLTSVAFSILAACSAGQSESVTTAQAHTIASTIQLQPGDLPPDWHRFGPTPFPSPENARLPAIAACIGISDPWNATPVAHASLVYFDGTGREQASSQTVVLATMAQENAAFSGYADPAYEGCYQREVRSLRASVWAKQGQVLSGFTATAEVSPPGIPRNDALAARITEVVMNPAASASSTRITEVVLMRHGQADARLSISIGYGAFPTDLFNHLASVLYARLTGRPPPPAPALHDG